jgi:hypothetical protein
MAESRQRLLRKVRRLRQQFEARYHRPMSREEARILSLAEQLSQGDAESVMTSELIESGPGKLPLSEATDSEPQSETE